MTDRRLFVIVVRQSGHATALAIVILISLFLASCSSSPGEDTPTSAPVSYCPASTNRAADFRFELWYLPRSRWRGSTRLAYQEGRRHTAATSSQWRRAHLAPCGRPLASNCQPGWGVVRRTRRRCNLQERHAGIWGPAQPRRNNSGNHIHQGPLGTQDETGTVY